MDNLNKFSTREEYNKNRSKMKFPSVSIIEDEGNKMIFDKRKDYTGHADTKGLYEIGWSYEDIFNFDYNVVNWDESKDALYVVPQADKDLMPMDKSKIKSTMKYCPYFDTSQETSMGHMFENCSALEYVPKLDTSKVTDMHWMFQSCSGLITVPLFDTSKVTEMGGMFSNCTSLTSVPKLDTRNVTNMTSMFFSCSGLTTVPLFNTSNVTNMDSMFAETPSFNLIPHFDTSKVTNMKYMFCGNSIKTIPQFNTSKVTNMNMMFWYCNELVLLPKFDTSNVTDMSYMFYRCSNLTDLGGFTGLKCDLDLSECPKLTKQSLLNVINEAASGVTGVTMTLGSTNLSKLTEEEKAIATNKGWNLS